jgi:DNA-binding MarR family transcriptional regulator
MVTGSGTATGTDSSLDRAADMALLASRALVGVAARSLAGVEDQITLVQYRALVLLDAGPQNVGTLAKALGIHPSTATRLCDRLVAKGLVERGTSSDSRREVSVLLSGKGRQLVHAVMTERRKALRRILRRLDPEARGALVEAFAAFGEAAGELPDQAWRLGWTA